MSIDQRAGGDEDEPDLDGKHAQELIDHIARARKHKWAVEEMRRILAVVMDMAPDAPLVGAIAQAYVMGIEPMQEILVQTRQYESEQRVTFYVTKGKVLPHGISAERRYG